MRTAEFDIHTRLRRSQRVDLFPELYAYRVGDKLEFRSIYAAARADSRQIWLYIKFMIMARVELSNSEAIASCLLRIPRFRSRLAVSHSLAALDDFPATLIGDTDGSGLRLALVRQKPSTSPSGRWVDSLCLYLRQPLTRLPCPSWRCSSALGRPQRTRDAQRSRSDTRLAQDAATSGEVVCAPGSSRHPVHSWLTTPGCDRFIGGNHDVRTTRLACRALWI